MTAAFTERDWDRIYSAAYGEFVTMELVATHPRKRSQVREKRVLQVEQAFRRFRDVIEDRNPPRSKDEAIRRIVGLLGTLLAIVFPQYALLIRIIGFLWDVSTGNNVTISGVASGAASNT